MGESGMGIGLGARRNDVVPSKLVAMWPLPFDKGLYPQLADWLKCDGNNGTPDMQGYFARGVPVGGDVILEQGEGNPECASAVGGSDAHDHDAGTYVTEFGHNHGLTLSWKGYNQGTPCVAGVYNIDAGHPVIDDTEDILGTAGVPPMDVSGTSAAASSAPPFKNVHYVMRA